MYLDDLEVTRSKARPPDFPPPAVAAAAEAEVAAVEEGQLEDQCV